jgi:hypothetical protein
VDFILKKDNVRIKENISFVDKVNVIKEIVASYFVAGNYTPYYRERATVIAIVNNFIEGIEFETEEEVYDSVCEDIEIMEIVEKFKTTHHMCMINKNVDDIVEFEKQRIIHGSSDLETIAEFCKMISNVLSNFSNLRLDLITPEAIEVGKEFVNKMKNQEITEETLANVISSIIENHKMPETEIYEHQRLRIEEQQKTLEEKENELKELRKFRKEHHKK